MPIIDEYDKQDIKEWIFSIIIIIVIIVVCLALVDVSIDILRFFDDIKEMKATIKEIGKQCQ